MGPNAAREIGRFYSEQEFDLGRLDNLRGSIAEAGRACIHPDYRSGAVIMMLWAGLAAFMKKEQCQYLIGCASVSLSDGGHNAAALYHSFNDTHLSPSEYRVTPHLPFPIEERESGHVAQIPPLIKGYLRSGAWVCGEPAWDPDFHSADFFLMLPLSKLDDRYARHYLKETRAA
jgi:putative hemolysin